jgi:DNA-binding phage protein
VVKTKAVKTAISCNPNNSGLTLSDVKMPTSRSYHSYLIESLKDPQEAAAYLDAVLEECNYDELLLALRNVVKARLTVSGSSQETFNKILSPQANLDLVVLLQALSELGFKLSVTTFRNVA